MSYYFTAGIPVDDKIRTRRNSQKRVELVFLRNRGEYDLIAFPRNLDLRSLEVELLRNTYDLRMSAVFNFYNFHTTHPESTLAERSRATGDSPTGLQDFNGILKQFRMLFEELAIGCNKSNPAPKQNGKLIQKRNLIEQRKMLRRLAKEFQIRIVAL